MAIYRIVDCGNRIEFRGCGSVMTISGDDADKVRGWMNEAKRWVPKDSTYRERIIDYVEYMATEEGWL